MRASSRTIAMAGIAAFALLASACSPSGGSSATTTTAKTGGAVTIRGCEPQAELIGSNTTEVCGGNIIDAFTAKLVHYNPDNAAPEMDIAESIDTSADFITHTVKLKKGYKFQDGTEVKAKNFVDAWNWAAAFENGQANEYFFAPIAGYADMGCQKWDDKKENCVEKPTVKAMSGLAVVDDHTFTIKTDGPVANLAIRLGYSAFTPQPDSFFAAADKKEWAKKPIGAGPFKVSSFDKATATVLEKFADYSGKYSAKVDKLTFKVYGDSNAAYNDVVANNLDLTDLIPADQLVGDVYKTQLKDRAAVKETLSFQALSFSPIDPGLKDVRIRQAISMAIDRQLINDKIFNNTRKPATGWAPPGVDGYKANVCGDACTFDAAAAKKLYDEAGGYKGTLELSVNGDGNHKPWADAFCNQLKTNLGLDCVVKVVATFSDYRNQIRERKLPGLFRAGWQADYPSIENYLTPIYATGASSNDTDYSNPQFDSLLKQAAAEGDTAKANALYQQAEAMLAKDFPTMPMFYSSVAYGWSTKVDNVKMTPFGTFDLTSVTVK